MYNQLARKKLRNGSALDITVLPATVQNEILPEAHRLHCAWVVQLWYSHSDDLTLGQAGVGGEPYAPFNPDFADPEPIKSNASLYFSLWNGGTRKVIARGAASFPPDGYSPRLPPEAADRGTVLALQVLKRLDQLR